MAEIDTVFRELRRGAQEQVISYDVTVQSDPTDEFDTVLVTINNDPTPRVKFPVRWRPMLTSSGALGRSFPRKGDGGIVVFVDEAQPVLTYWRGGSEADEATQAMFVPIGVPMPWLVATIPDGYVEFNGGAITDPPYPILVSLFGANLPDLRDKFLMGASGTHPVGEEGGADAVTLTAAQSGSPAHNHGAGTLDITSWAVAATAGGVVSMPPLQTAGTYAFQNPAPATVITGGTANSAATNASQSHENKPPYRAVKWITRAG